MRMNSVRKLPTVRGAAWTNVILYDGVCNFCNSCVNWVKRMDKHNKFTLTPLQSEDGKEIMNAIKRSDNDLSTVVYVRQMKCETESGNENVCDGLEIFDKSDAAIHVLEELFSLPRALVSFVCTILPKSLRDGVYDLVARNRHSIMGTREDCGCSSPKPAPDSSKT